MAKNPGEKDYVSHGDFEGFSTPTPKPEQRNIWSRLEKFGEELKDCKNEVRNYQRETQKLIDIVDNLRKELGETRKENRFLREENEKLRKEKKGEGGWIAKLVKDEVENQIMELKEDKLTEVIREQVSSEVCVLKEERKKDAVSFKEIIAQQEQERRINMDQEIVQVIRNKEKLLREIAEKKRSVIITGVIEEKIPARFTREKKEEEKVKEILRNLTEEEPERLVGEIDEITRLGKYDEEKNRPIKLTLKSQTAAEMITSKSWVLSTKQGYKKVYIRKNMNEEERKNFKEMVVDVKMKNEERTEEEKEKFFWRIRNDKVMKWWRKKE